MRLELGSEVRCSDGPVGELVNIVVDPLTCRVTHLVVEPHHRHWMARLVPIELVRAAAGERSLELACTIAQARRLETVEHSAFVPIGGELRIDDPDWDVGGDGVLALPYYGADAWTRHDAVAAVTYDRIPKGEVEIRRGSTVTTADDHRAGRVEGFVADGDQITHVLLERGHLWGKREITVPIADVSAVTPTAISLRLTRDEVGRLETLAVHRGHGGGVE